MNSIVSNNCRLNSPLLGSCIYRSAPNPYRDSFSNLAVFVAI